MSTVQYSTVRACARRTELTVSANSSLSPRAHAAGRSPEANLVQRRFEHRKRTGREGCARRGVVHTVKHEPRHPREFRLESARAVPVQLVMSGGHTAYSSIAASQVKVRNNVFISHYSAIWMCAIWIQCAQFNVLAQIQVCKFECTCTLRKVLSPTRWHIHCTLQIIMWQICHSYIDKDPHVTPTLITWYSRVLPD